MPTLNFYSRNRFQIKKEVILGCIIWDCEQYEKENAAKDDLVRGLVSGSISHRFEIIREYTGHIGGRNIASNTFSTIFSFRGIESYLHNFRICCFIWLG